METIGINSELKLLILSSRWVNFQWRRLQIPSNTAKACYILHCGNIFLLNSVTFRPLIKRNSLKYCVHLQKTVLITEISTLQFDQYILQCQILFYGN
jgi:hypothetical protein